MGYTHTHMYYDPDAPSMEYIPTFGLQNDPNVGKYTIHGAYG